MPDEDRKNRREFSTTQWSLVLAAGDSQNPEFQDALATLCGTYWYPLYAYIRLWGSDADTAQDLVQGFFSHLLKTKALRVAAPERGRFRSFLLVSVKNYLANERERAQALKRGGGETPIPLDFHSAESWYRLQPAHQHTPEKAFEKRWALALLEKTLARLREETADSNNPERFGRLSAFLTDDSPRGGYQQVATQLGMSEGAVKVAVHRMRRHFGELLRAEVAQTVDDPRKVDEEIRYLFSAMES